MTYLLYCPQSKAMILTGESQLLQSSLQRSIFICLMQISSLWFIQTTNRLPNSLMQNIMKAFLHAGAINYAYSISAFNKFRERKTLQLMVYLKLYSTILIALFLVQYISLLKKFAYTRITTSGFGNYVQEIIEGC